MGMDRGASLNKLELQKTPLAISTLAVLRTSAGLWVRQIPQQQSRDWSPEEGSRYSAGKPGSKQEHSHLTHQHLVQDGPVLYVVQHLSLCASAEKSTPIPPPTPWCRKCYTDRLTNTICFAVAFDSLPPACNSLRWSKCTNTILHFLFLYVVKEKQSKNVLFISQNIALSFPTEFACTVSLKKKRGAGEVRNAMEAWSLTRNSYFNKN